MNTKLLGLFAAAAMFALAGCNKAESPRKFSTTLPTRGRMRTRK